MLAINEKKVKTCRVRDCSWAGIGLSLALQMLQVHRVKNRAEVVARVSSCNLRTEWNVSKQAARQAWRAWSDVNSRNLIFQRRRRLVPGAKCYVTNFALIVIACLVRCVVTLFEVTYLSWRFFCDFNQHFAHHTINIHSCLSDRN